MSDFPAYPFLDEAAAEARKASRRYWQKGGEADTKYPIHRDVYRWWKIKGDDPQQVLEASISRHRGNKRK